MTDGYTRAEANFAAEVARERKGKGWTLAEMAAQLESAGVPSMSVMSVQRVENAKRHVSMVEADAYAKVFQRSLFSLTNPEPVDKFIDELGESTLHLAKVWRETVAQVRGYRRAREYSRGQVEEIAAAERELDPDDGRLLQLDIERRRAATVIIEDSELGTRLIEDDHE